jgi:hypothetical protein
MQSYKVEQLFTVYMLEFVMDFTVDDFLWMPMIALHSYCVWIGTVHFALIAMF